METVELEAHPLLARPLAIRVFRPEPHVPEAAYGMPEPGQVEAPAVIVMPGNW